MELETILDISSYLSYQGISGAPTQADMQKYFKNQNTLLRALTKQFIWQPNDDIVVGKRVYSPNLTDYLCLECAIAGKTGTAEPDLSTLVTGNILIDNSVTWIACDIRDSLPVGEIFNFTHLHDGYVKANGSSVLRASYPRLYTFANTNSKFYDDGTKVFDGTTTSSSDTISGISTTDIATLTALGILPIYITGTGIPSGTKITAIGTTSVTISAAATASGTVSISYGNIDNFPGLFGMGDGSTTMVLPNVVGRKAQPTDSVVAGGRIDAGLPNITGGLNNMLADGIGVIASTSAIFYGSGSNYSTNKASTTSGNCSYDPQFNASRSNSIYGNSNTVQDSAYATISQIKY